MTEPEHSVDSETDVPHPDDTVDRLVDGPPNHAVPQPVDARARHARPPKALLHRVMVDPHTGPAEAALCGAAPTSGWTVNPAWPDARCPKCERVHDTSQP